MNIIENIPVYQLAGAILFVILAPFIGAVITGIDRKITARMQGRVGPPVLQPLYDIFKLFEKENIVVHESQNFWIFSYLIFIIVTGVLFFAGSDILLVIFALTLAHVFLVLGAYSTGSPYAHVGAERELIQLMAFEPIIIIAAIGFYEITKTFDTLGILQNSVAPIILMPGIFIGMVYVFTIKLRKSPFDLSTSHHAHQELVKGLTTEFSGSTLGMTEIAHLYELVFLLGFLFLFFGMAAPVIGLIALIVVYFLELLVDNATARIKWQLLLKSCWIITAVFGVVNLMALYFI
ncbi:NADH-quinone oxidoreductase subunit H [Methanoplanus sp. FWC-SCC4]|uniref:NADH-quinone oxidoreductase subunit H n=1 Tax=Methanochimaera problematica TaxID=2609417 RepID=A0AA97FAH4_9EURY|nr:complex I subunit 1 family protein [Methanoplanus sp. FWC-SCC4]WOF15805.1 NADH-quinone oxidoreductase subunit H [Methanoplanus sp. FWC-SCC4]